MRNGCLGWGLEWDGVSWDLDLFVLYCINLSGQDMMGRRFDAVFGGLGPLLVLPAWVFGYIPIPIATRFASVEAGWG